MSTRSRRRKAVDYTETTDLTELPAPVPKKKARKGKGKAAPVVKKEPELVILSSSDDECVTSTASVARAKLSTPILDLENLDELAIVNFEPFGAAWVVEKVPRSDPKDKTVVYKLQYTWGEAFVTRDSIQDLARDVLFNYSTGKGSITITKADKCRLSPMMYVIPALYSSSNALAIVPNAGT
jgi:hypothetical protein